MTIDHLYLRHLRNLRTELFAYKTIDASGLIEDLNNGMLSACAVNQTCSYGLHNYYHILEIEGAWGPLITAGVFSSTLSSALASTVSAPKVLQKGRASDRKPFRLEKALERTKVKHFRCDESILFQFFLNGLVRGDHQ
ncbi:hypothetical protein D918_06688 [Trichuris suis]|nr:hypothetical protein D918_06688 [Trichuris suis]